MNNVGRGSFGIGQVQRAFFEALTTLKAKMVRVNTEYCLCLVVAVVVF